MSMCFALSSATCAANTRRSGRPRPGRCRRFGGNQMDRGVRRSPRNPDRTARSFRWANRACRACSVGRRLAAKLYRFRISRGPTRVVVPNCRRVAGSDRETRLHSSTFGTGRVWVSRSIKQLNRACWKRIAASSIESRSSKCPIGLQACACRKCAPLHGMAEITPGNLGSPSDILIVRRNLTIRILIIRPGPRLN
jgi:hypothetical protein